MIKILIIMDWKNLGLFFLTYYIYYIKSYSCHLLSGWTRHQYYVALTVYLWKTLPDKTPTFDIFYLFVFPGFIYHVHSILLLWFVFFNSQWKFSNSVYPYPVGSHFKFPMMFKKKNCKVFYTKLKRRISQGCHTFLNFLKVFTPTQICTYSKKIHGFNFLLPKKICE